MNFRDEIDIEVTKKNSDIEMIRKSIAEQDKEIDLLAAELRGLLFAKRLFETLAKTEPPKTDIQHDVEIIPTSEPTTLTVLEPDEVIISPFEFDKSKLKTYKSIKIYVDENDSDNPLIASIYGTGTYYTNLKNLLKIPHPLPNENFKFGLTWHNNNRAAIKMAREYIASTNLDPDRSMYKMNISDTKVQKKKLDDLWCPS